MTALLLATGLCCRAILRNEEPPWSHALLSALLGSFSSLWVIFRGNVLHPGSWPRRITGQWDLFVSLLAPSISFTITVVLIAVALFRERFSKHLPTGQKELPQGQKRQRSWHRARWFNLFASSTLIVGLTGALVWSHSARISPNDTAIVSDYSVAYNWNAQSPSTRAPQGTATRTSPAFDLAPITVLLWPVCMLGLLASGGWLAYTVTYWRGYMRVKPRNLNDLLTRHPPPATGQ